MGNTKEEATKTYSLRLSENALVNIDEITGYIAFIKHEPLSAIHVGDEIFATIDRIEKNPMTFRECEEIPTKNKIYRKAVCMSWLIIYRIRGKEIVILGIMHASRRISRIKGLKSVK
jgi:plasmid stabilization system protein ParE